MLLILQFDIIVMNFQCYNSFYKLLYKWHCALLNSCLSTFPEVFHQFL